MPPTSTMLGFLLMLIVGCQAAQGIQDTEKEGTAPSSRSLPDGVVAVMGAPGERHTSVVESLKFSPDGKALASASDDATVRLWDPATGRALRTLVGHKGYVYSIAFSPDGKALASGGADGAVRLWSLATGRMLRVLTGHDFGVNSVAFSPDASILASGSTDGTIRFWNWESGESLRTIEAHSKTVLCIAFSPDGRLIASGSGDSTARLWSAGEGQLIRTLGAHQDYVFCVALSRNGKTLASGSRDRAIMIWDHESGQRLRTLAGHSDAVYCLEFSANGKIIVSSSLDRTMRVWDAVSGGEIRVLEGHSKVALFRDGHTLASGGADGTVFVWDLRPRGWKQKRALEQLWSDLVSDTAAVSYAATWSLAAQDGAVAFLRDRLFPGSDEERFRRLFTQLSGEGIEIREAAEQALSDASYIDLVARARHDASNAETRRRLERIIESWEMEIATEARRRSKVIQALEWIGTAEAKKALRDLGEHSPIERERQEAMAALARMQ